MRASYEIIDAEKRKSIIIVIFSNTIALSIQYRSYRSPLNHFHPPVFIAVTLDWTPSKEKLVQRAVNITLTASSGADIGLTVRALLGGTLDLLLTFRLFASLTCYISFSALSITTSTSSWWFEGFSLLDTSRLLIMMQHPS